MCFSLTFFVETYNLICRIDSGFGYWVYSDSDTYADGNIFYDLAGWNSISDYDLYFTINIVCSGGGGDPHFVGFRGNFL